MIVSEYVLSQIFIAVAFAFISATYLVKSRANQLGLMIGSNIFMVLGFHVVRCLCGGGDVHCRDIKGYD
jgi:hypothetical protein